MLEGLNSMPPLGYCMACEISDYRAMIGFMAGTNERQSQRLVGHAAQRGRVQRRLVEGAGVARLHVRAGLDQAPSDGRRLEGADL